MQIEVVRSSRRRKTVQARVVSGVLQVRIPASMSLREEHRWFEEMTSRFERRARADRIDLEVRAAVLARRHRLPHPTAVRWVDNQHARWGSCSPATGQIRISSRLGGFPAWVLDYVIVHELAHLAEVGHSPAFWELVDRYPRAERARGFRIAKGGED
ncbi:M48 family metallopeptidase [soil metagenome]